MNTGDAIAYFISGAGIVASIGAVSVITADMLGINEKKAVLYIMIFCILSAIVGYGLKTYVPL